MKTVILCGGLGTRLAEETGKRPKPMVYIGGKPILWHILDIYGRQGHNDFVLALGYKGEQVKEYFLNYYAMTSDATVDLDTGNVSYRTQSQDRRNWKVALVDTGQTSQTGGRLLRLKQTLAADTFMVTYGDGVANVDLAELLKVHRAHGKLVTVTAVRPLSRFGGLRLNTGQPHEVEKFVEKPDFTQTLTDAQGQWINGGFFVMEPGVFDYIDDDATNLERDALERIAADGQMAAHAHHGFWQCMDTVRDRDMLEELCATGHPPWI
ncbi:MAG: glucose-1-phosphate cytidylyltransferase [Gammaproteobacteria bacterium]|nr:glucose-1-phosphate cytidylyltransferase [Gammaproteobacteria bacterium]MDH3767522.1 glucose-1-phosphate cytidylyltransferase [Gammaproteobacteria bacterium]